MDPSTISEPITSPLFTDPLVIADLGAPPWDADVLIDVGFRHSGGKSIIYLADFQPSGSQRLPTRLESERSKVLWIDPNSPAKFREYLVNFIRKANREAPRSWLSQHALVDLKIPLNHPNDAIYTDANEAAAKLYGFDHPTELIGKPVDIIDEHMYGFMTKKQRESFLTEQGNIFRAVLGNRNTAQVSVKFPLWLIKQSKEQGVREHKVYLPLLVQHKFEVEESGRKDSIANMRVVFLDITSWTAGPLNDLPESHVLKIPRMFRNTKAFSYDVFLAFDQHELSVMSQICALLERFECNVYFTRDGAERSPPQDLIQAMFSSRIVAIPIGDRDIGQWVKKRKDVHDALYSIASGNTRTSY